MPAQCHPSVCLPANSAPAGCQTNRPQPPPRSVCACSEFAPAHGSTGRHQMQTTILLLADGRRLFLTALPPPTAAKAGPDAPPSRINQPQHQKACWRSRAGATLRPSPPAAPLSRICSDSTVCAALYPFALNFTTSDARWQPPYTKNHWKPNPSAQTTKGPPPGNSICYKCRYARPPCLLPATITRRPNPQTIRSRACNHSLWTIRKPHDDGYYSEVTFSSHSRSPSSVNNGAKYSISGIPLAINCA